MNEWILWQTAGILCSFETSHLKYKKSLPYESIPKRAV